MCVCVFVTFPNLFMSSSSSNNRADIYASYNYLLDIYANIFLYFDKSENRIIIFELAIILYIYIYLCR